MSGRYAVVIGINYRNFPATMDQEVQSRAAINALNYAEADAEEMAEQLSADGYDVVKLVGTAATRAAIINALRTQSRNAGPEGLLLVHYSGHGALDPDDRELAYLLPADADPQEMSIFAIALNDIATRRLLGQTRSALVLLDCCHSGYAVDFKSGDKDIMLTNEAQAFSQQAGLTFRGVSGRVIIAACGGQQLARERQDLQHGVLTYYVLQHWRNSTKSVNDLNLYEYLAERMRPQQGVPDPVRGGSAQQGVIELRPARTPTIYEPASIVPRLSPSERATLFRLILEIVQTPTDFLDLTFYIDLEFKANSHDADLRSMIRSFIKQAEAAKLIPELREAIDQFRADQQVNNLTPSKMTDGLSNTSGAQHNTLDNKQSTPMEQDDDGMIEITRGELLEALQEVVRDLSAGLKGNDREAYLGADDLAQNDWFFAGVSDQEGTYSVTMWPGEGEEDMLSMDIGTEDGVHNLADNPEMIERMTDGFISAIEE
jgi:hypothetical protein